MIEYFDYRPALKHAIEEYPNESCGFIIDSPQGELYIPLENIHENPANDFRIRDEDYLKYEDSLKCVMHSHNNFKHCSKKDMEQQRAMGVPWGIVDIYKKNYQGHWFFGDELPIQDYLGRPFHYGCYDCLSLVYDYYRKEFNIIIPNPPRDWDFWFTGEKMFEDHLLPLFKTGEFRVVESWKHLQPGDALLFKLNSSRVWNHSAVYIGNNRIMHHFEKNLSCEALLNNWLPYCCTIVRHKDVKHD